MKKIISRQCHFIKSGYFYKLPKVYTIPPHTTILRYNTFYFFKFARFFKNSLLILNISDFELLLACKEELHHRIRLHKESNERMKNGKDGNNHEDQLSDYGHFYIKKPNIEAFKF